MHGKQEGRFFHGYYKRYCYLPLYIFCGEHLLCARLRSSDRGAAHGVVPELKGIVRRLREAWPQVRITVCGDSDFSKDELMLWCETEGVDYVFGLAQNPRLKQPIATAMEAVRQRQQASGKAEREFQELRYQTLDTWTRERRVVAKVEHLPRGENPRFIVTSVPVQECAGRRLYEVVYCGRGEMENRIKEQQLGLFADRTSSRKLQANQLRLYFSSFAYVMLQRLRQWGLAGTELAFAQCWTIRVDNGKVLKIGAQVRVTSRKVWLSFSFLHPPLAIPYGHTSLLCARRSPGPIATPAPRSSSRFDVNGEGGPPRRPFGTHRWRRDSESRPALRHRPAQEVLCPGDFPLPGQASAGEATASVVHSELKRVADRAGFRHRLPSSSGKCPLESVWITSMQMASGRSAYCSIDDRLLFS